MLPVLELPPLVEELDDDTMLDPLVPVEALDVLVVATIPPV